MNEKRLTDEQLDALIGGGGLVVGWELSMYSELKAARESIRLYEGLLAVKRKAKTQWKAELKAARGEIARLNQMIDAGRGVNARLKAEIARCESDSF